MSFYHIWALIKILIWSSIIYLLYNYINIYQDPIIGLGFWFFAIFLIVWWLSFYMFFIWQKIFSQKELIKIASKSYKLSLLFWLFVIINLSLIVLEQRDKLLWFIILIIFLALHILTAFENE